MSYRKQHRIDKPKIQYQAYCEIANATDAQTLNQAILRYFYSFVGEIEYCPYYGDVTYDHAHQQFNLQQYTFNYSRPIPLPFTFVQSYYLNALAHCMPAGYLTFRRNQTTPK